MKAVVDMKQQDIDGFLAGMSRMLASSRKKET